MLKVLLIDDERLALENLKILIKNYCPYLQVIDTASSVDEGIAKVNKLKPDAIFLDVNMPGKNGFEMLAHLNPVPSVIFVTAHEKYALQAMKVCAVDFLLKPIDINELMEVQIKLLTLKTLKPEIKNNYGQVLRNLSILIDQPGTVRKITLYVNNGYEIFEMDDIVYLSGEDNYTLFHFKNHKNVMVSRTLKNYEEILQPFGFMRIHKTTMINLSHVKRIKKNESTEVVMNNGEHLQVSRRKWADLMEWGKKSE